MPETNYQQLGAGTAGSFLQPASPLDCGNSGTTMRLLLPLVETAAVQGMKLSA